MARNTSEQAMVSIIIGLVLAVLIVLVTYVMTNMFKQHQVKNLEGPFWLDSLVCSESVCTMSLRNSYENRLEVIVSRETAGHINGVVGN